MNDENGTLTNVILRTVFAGLGLFAVMHSPKCECSVVNFQAHFGTRPIKGLGLLMTHLVSAMCQYYVNIAPL